MMNDQEADEQVLLTNYRVMNSTNNSSNSYIDTFDRYYITDSPDIGINA